MYSSGLQSKLIVWLNCSPACLRFTPLNFLYFVWWIFFFSSGVLDVSERDSNLKTRWNSAINQQDRTSASSSSECSPDHTLRKTKKSRNEETVLLRFVGDINILVTPLLLEALQRYAIMGNNKEVGAWKFNPFYPCEWLASTLSIQHHPWITHKRVTTIYFIHTTSPLNHTQGDEYKGNNH